MAVILEIKKKNKSIKLSGALLMTMGLDWFLQEIGLKESTNIRRLITGFMGGIGLFGLYFAVLRRTADSIKNIVLRCFHAALY